MFTNSLRKWWTKWPKVYSSISRWLGTR